MHMPVWGASKRLCHLFFLFPVLVVAASVLAMGSSVPVSAADRVALIIGNNNYKHAPKLTNAVNDARGVAGVLRTAGFSVIEAYDQTARDIENALDVFSGRVAGARIGIVYFAGHGIQYQGTAYLVPIDVDLTDERDLRKTVSAEYFLQDSARASDLGVVILDACRDNPFLKQMAETLGTTRSISLGRGLSRVKSVPKKTLIAYATQAGNVALDGARSNSPYATALMKHLVTPGKDVRLVFGAVRDEVLALTSGKQEPFTYGSLGADEIHLIPSTTKRPAGKPQKISALNIPNVEKLAAISSDYVAWKQAIYLQSWDPLDRIARVDTSSYFAMIYRMLDRERTARLSPVLALARGESAEIPIDRLGKRDISAIQRALRNLNFYGGYIDGSFGRDTEHALTQFAHLETGSARPSLKTLIRLGELSATRQPTSELTGTWSGRYEYPTKRKGVDFTMNLNFSQGLISGSIIEPNTFGDRTARNLYAHFKGTVGGNRVRWVKKYDGTGGVGHSVVYEGQLDRASRSVTGRWIISAKWSGTFVIRLKP